MYFFFNYIVAYFGPKIIAMLRKFIAVDTSVNLFFFFCSAYLERQEISKIRRRYNLLLVKHITSLQNKSEKDASIVVHIVNVLLLSNLWCCLSWLNIIPRLYGRVKEPDPTLRKQNPRLSQNNSSLFLSLSLKTY